MASTSKHPLDIYRWIERVIESCTTTRQLKVADKLIYNFDKYANGKIDNDLLSDLRRNLVVHSNVKSTILSNEEFDKKISKFI
jgi:hypothetical protein